jgi:hypothetical protein
MKVKELIEALQEKLIDPEKEVRVVSTYDNYEIAGIYITDDGVDIDLERKE